MIYLVIKGEKTMQIEEIVAKLQEQGLDREAIEASLKEMLEKGEITEEDLQKAIQMLESSEEKALAEKLYGEGIAD